MTAVPVTSTAITLHVFGVPQPKGSMSAVRRGTRTVMLEGKSAGARAASTSWRQAVEQAARDWQAEHQAPLLDVPVGVSFTFWLPRPPSAPKRRVLPDRKPDIDKLVRHALDALTGIVLVDDARVCDLHASKRYAGEVPPGALIRIEVLT